MTQTYEHLSVDGPVRAILGGTPVDLMTRPEAVATILSAARSVRPVPLAVASANLDHIHHFGSRGRWRSVLEETSKVEWLTLLDGHPLVMEAARLAGKAWPRLAGSDLIEELLDQAQESGISVGFLGGTSSAHEQLQRQLSERWPRLVVAGMWAPERSAIVERDHARELAQTVRSAGTQLLFVGLGKPRQELWIAEYGAITGAAVLLAFGASADFVAGISKRAPRWISDVGMEWLWRLVQEPRRLANRYLVQEPSAYADLRRNAALVSPAPPSRAPATVRPTAERPPPGVTAIVVTYNSAEHIGALLSDLASQVAAPHLRTVVVDNGSSDETCALVREAGVELIETSANLGYAGAINVGLRSRDERDAVLVLNPDLRLATDALASMWALLQAKGAGVVVPRLVDGAGRLYESLRFEPSLLGGLGDAFFGSRLATRPAWLADIDRDPESYQFPHPVDWATGAALLIEASLAERVGEWNEDFFLYCEETDFFRRARATGAQVWFDPGARVSHSAHGSGSSPELDALMAVNRVRYAELHHGRTFAGAMRGVAVLAELLRIHKGATHRRALKYLLTRNTWGELPCAVPAVSNEVLAQAL